MESMHKWFLHSTMIISSMVIAYYGIQSMHAVRPKDASVNTHVGTQGQVVFDPSRGEGVSKMIQDRIHLNEKLIRNYETQIREMEKLKVSPDSAAIRFARQQSDGAREELARLKAELSK